MCFITAGPITKLFAWGGRRVEDMCYERRRAEAWVDESAHHALGDFVCVANSAQVARGRTVCVCVLLLQDLLQRCSRGGVFVCVLLLQDLFTKLFAWGGE